MNKTELLAVVAMKTEMTQKDVNLVVDTLINTITETLASGEKVVVTGFGTFEVRTRVERTGKNPRNGELIVVPEQKSPAFRAGKLLKDAVKK
ncbi:HU family DNA-binding protein [Haploplasma modicum]|jgi:DNA-binding protein HU-beta|uniref:HU family DNA-binding protein n=1 Tax=Haploplasma modicum TaxID=2150 RepID=UPI00047B1993|nr:HU family DNA-binding protein [Haploplasma modicum]MCR1809059.1 HU family DNA-binding protein [Haploplasma modicum]